MARSRTKIAAAIILFFIGIAWNIGTFDRRALALRRYQPRFATLLEPPVAKVLSMGFRSFAADLYWIGAVNYFGDNRNRKVAYRALPNYLELVLALDPDFRYAYQFGGTALPWNTGEGWVNVREAIDILERGVDRFPQDWRMRFHLAFLYSSFENRYKDAGDQLAAAAPIPDAPPFLGQLAARMYASTGDYATAEAIATELMNSIDDEEIREGLSRRVLEIRTVENVSRLESLVHRFLKDLNRLPKSLEELVERGYIDAIPAESLGGIFVYNADSGEVRSSVLNDRLKVFGKNEHLAD